MPKWHPNATTDGQEDIQSMHGVCVDKGIVQKTKYKGTVFSEGDPENSNENTLQLEHCRLKKKTLGADQKLALIGNFFRFLHKNHPLPAVKNEESA